MAPVKLIGESANIKHLITIAKKLAKNHTLTTLIIGENGTGKEVVARFIHENSLNSDKPFVDINCGAIPESLLESELFGHEKGSFTGASSVKSGLFEIADNGTVFLDEIANTSLNFQSKLLKAVESKCFRRVGGLNEITVSARIIAATNVDIQEAVKQGRFREDLYYRLNIGQIVIPPLRERKGDAILLALHFFDMVNKEYDRGLKGFRPETLQLIAKYPWPGNVRELRNVIERAVLIESEEWIKKDDLKLNFELENDSENEAGEKKLKYSMEDIDNLHFPTKGIALEELEKGIILSALEKADGNLSKAARLLKINRGKLRYKLEKLDISI